jgi:glycosyltransferase involved in cell wall biosynthesis
MPKVSVIIPCYNQGEYLEEAVESVLAQIYRDFEIIIVNDGSTDDVTNRLLENYRRPKTRVLQTTNQGLAQARNNGIREALGKYILPLDADDRIGSRYLEKAVKAMDNDPEIGITYCLAEFFGSRGGHWNLPEYSFPLMLVTNAIFCSGVFTKTDWEKAGGYNSNMKYAFEDWIWLSIIEKGKKVYRIQEVQFYYRTRPMAMSKSLSALNRLEMYLQVYRNHKYLYMRNIWNVVRGWMAFARLEDYRQ